MVGVVHITVGEEVKNKAETRDRHNPRRPDAEDLLLPARLQLQSGPQPPQKSITSRERNSANIRLWGNISGSSPNACLAFLHQLQLKET